VRGQGQAAVLYGRRDVRVMTYPVNEPPDDGVLLGVALAGICGSDLHRFQEVGAGLGLDLPVVMGHETVARVLRLGRDAVPVTVDGEALRAGDRVVVYSSRPCGRCFWCREFGHTARCDGPRPAAYGYHYGRADDPPHFTGGLADYLYLEPDTWLWKLPPTMPWEVAVLVEPFSMGIRAVERALSLPGWKNEQTLGFGGTVAVLGAGAIGVLTAAAARIAGAGRIVLLGAPQSALAAAERAGVADVTVDISTVGAAERIRSVKALTRGGYGADVVFEAAGAPAAFVEGLEMLRPLGTYVELGCMADTGATVPLNVARHLTQKDLVLYTVAAQPPQAFGKALRCLDSRAGGIDFASFVELSVPVAEAPGAFARLEHPTEKPIKAALIGAGYDG
jgi:threonine dehydrogenase-like Zn-dependent dehydrogenase